MSLIQILFLISVLITQIIYYNNYRNGIKPSFLRVFQMMSGLVTPTSLGLQNEKQITKLINHTRIGVKYSELNNKYVVRVIGWSAVFLIYLSCLNYTDAIFYGIANAFIFMIAHCVYGTVILSNQFLVFHVICLYLKLKINALNESLLEMNRRKRFVKMRETLQSFDSLYSEINEYNTTYWSKLLLMYWILFSLYNVLMPYIMIFVQVNIAVQFTFIYCCILWGSCFLFLIFTASSVTHSVNKSYKTMNSLVSSYSRYNKHSYSLKIITKLKVIDYK